MTECGVLLNLDASDARALVAAVDAELRAVKSASSTASSAGTEPNPALGKAEAGAALERLREAHGVHRLTASQVARVLSKRSDAGRGGGS